MAVAGLLALGATVLPGSHPAAPARADLAAASGNAYTALNPYRLLDTRKSDQTMGSNSTLNLPVTGTFGTQVVPGDATAVALNVTVTDTSAPGYLTVYPTGGTRPTASNLNWSPGQIVANMVIVPTGTSGDVTIYNFQGAVDVVVDLEGYFAPPATAGSATGSYVPLAPSRIADTRPGSGEAYQGETLHANSTLSVQVTGDGGVPASGVTAVLLNVTATNTTASSYLTAYPNGETPRPTASNLNWSAGTTIANRVLVPLQSNGEVSLYNFVGNVDVVVDVDGYVNSGATGPAAASDFYPITPQRVTDTRSGSGYAGAGNPLTTGDTFNQQITSVAGVAADAIAVVTNVTATDGTAPGYFTVFAEGTTRPTSSDLNWRAGETVPNLTVAPLGTTGALSVYNFQGTTDLIIDASGYFVPVVPEPPSMVSATVTATSIAITYDEAVSCDPTGADGAFAYFSSGTTSGGAATGCTTSGDVLTLAGTFTLPTGDGSIVYTAPATSTTTTAVYATAAPTVFAATQTLAVAAVPTMESGSVTTTSIAITYNEGVSCAATGVDGAFAYFSSGTTAGGTATGCTSSGDVLTLAGTFTLPTGTGSITYTPPASSTTSNAVYDTLVPTEFAANEVLQLRPVPAMVSASVTTSAITIDYNISVTCKTGGTAYQAFTYDSATSTPGGTITGCTAGNGDVLTLAGTFTLPTATASIVYTAPPTPSTITAVYATSYSTDFAATQTLELAVAPIMESTAWTASTIQITYNELVSCDMTGADTDFTYNSATSTSGGTITGCTFSGDALTLSGSFTLPTGSGTIGYTEPATPSTSNAVYSTAINSEFAPSGSLPVRPMPTMLSATVTATSITITYNTAVSCSPSGGADGDFAYDFSTSTSGGTVTSCHHTNAVLTLDGSFSVPTGTASITYTEPASPSVTNAVYSTAVPTDFEATETLLDANIS